MRKFLFTLICAFVVLCACTPQKEKNMQKLESLAADRITFLVPLYHSLVPLMSD